MGVDARLATEGPVRRAKRGAFGNLKLRFRRTLRSPRERNAAAMPRYGRFA